MKLIFLKLRRISKTFILLILIIMNIMTIFINTAKVKLETESQSEIKKANMDTKLDSNLKTNTNKTNNVEINPIIRKRLGSKL